MVFWQRIRYRLRKIFLTPLWVRKPRAQRTQRRGRFTLRRLLAFTALMALLSAACGGYWRSATRQKSAVAALRQDGAEIYYSPSVDVEGKVVFGCRTTSWMLLGARRFQSS